MSLHPETGNPVSSQETISSTNAMTSTSKALFGNYIASELHHHLQQKFKNDPYFKWVIIGGALYISLHFTKFGVYTLWPAKKLFAYCYNKFRIPESVLMWLGDVESEIPFGRLGYTRCMEADTDVLEKYDIPMNAEKCLRDGIQFIPGEFYQQFDLNEYDPKLAPLTWSYGPITDPSLIMPICWYNDTYGENQEFELFSKYMMIFGYLPPCWYEELFKHCKIRLLSSNQRLIKIGDSDDKVYIVVQGAIDVYSNRIGPHNDFIRLRTVTHGGHISSLFSIIDAFAGHARIIQSIYAVSKLNTTKVLVFPVAALKDYLVRYPEYLVSSVIRLLESGYRFQYQIMHVAMRLAKVTTILDPHPQHDPPNVIIPSPDEEIPANVQHPFIKEKAIMSFMNYLQTSNIDFLRQNCNVFVFVIDAEPVSSDISVIKSSLLNKPDAAYKYIYVGTLENFYLKSNVSPIEQLSKRKNIQEAVVYQPLTKFYSGEGMGSLTGILGYSNVLFSRCLERSMIVSLNHDALQTILEISPYSVFSIAYSTISRMSPFNRATDFGIDFTSAQEGQYIYHKEQTCHDSYFILSGRARSYQLDSDSDHRAILEYKENDWMGVIESLLQSKRRSKTCVVIRATEFVKIPNDLLRNIIIHHSDAAQIMLNFLVSRTLKSRKFASHNPFLVGAESESLAESRKIHSIALVPVAEGLPYAVLAVEFKQHFLPWGSCKILTYEIILEKMGKPEITVMDQFKLKMHILKELGKNDLVIFICVPRIHYWNEICSSHSEVIFTVGCTEIPNISTIPPDFEEEIIGKKISTRRKELIILHRMDVTLPKNTKEWLYCRDWIHFHHHIRLPNDAFQLLGAIPEETIELRYASLNREITLCSDLSRFTRWIQGTTVGVLFSSGGARIGAQLGMLQALTEYKRIPIDMVVGTGSGFLLAAIYAIYQDYSHVQNIVEKVFKDFADLTKLRWDDITLPYISLGKGKRLLVYFYQLFGSVQLEDTWIPMCCVTTNLTSEDVRVDRSGPMWVFVRASFSHITNGPPICDPVDQDYICDGAHANSLPQDILKEYGAEYIIAFNTVGGKLITNVDNPADPNISVLRFLKKTLYSVVEQLGLASPSFETVFEQLALTQTRMYAAGAEAVSNLNYVVYVRPPVEHVASQAWKNLPVLHRIGYFYMKAILEKNPHREDIPFHEFWTNIKRTSADLVKADGRDIKL